MVIGSGLAMTWADQNPNIIDWLNLPPSASAISLWDCLHDAEVVSVRSNLLDRTMTLLLESDHLREFHKLGDPFQFVFDLRGVESARASRSAIWPGECSIPQGATFEEQRQIVDEYQSKWREESWSWDDFESCISGQDKHVLGIADAALAMSNVGPVAAKICGLLDYNTYHEIYLRFEKLAISGSDGTPYSLEQFRGLGEAYWLARSQR